MAFEKERKTNNLIIAAGAILSALGLAIYFMTAQKVPGVLILILGVSLLVIGLTISNALFKIRMVEMLKENRKK
ncbi:MAG: hypothetical protein FWG41_04750 [Methanomassiliicoccaceae archaeon]|nr:hypothetical protein [Methanomassiliicoccaceae archaeon]